MGKEQKAVPNIPLREQRVLRKMTQADLAEVLGVSELTVGRWERGESFPTSYAARKLGSFFGMTLAELGLEDPGEQASLLPDMPREDAELQEEPLSPEAQETTGQQAGMMRFPQRASRRGVLLGGIGVAGLLATGGALGLAHFWLTGSGSSASAKKAQAGPRDMTPFPVYEGHKTMVIGLAWSPDDAFIASRSRDGILHIWEASTGHDAFEDRCHQEQIYAIVWSPDGRYLASTGADSFVQVRDGVFTGQTSSNTCSSLFRYTGHTSVVRCLAWSPDSNFIASGSTDQTLQVWNALKGSLRFKNTSLGDIRGLAWSPDGLYLASGSSDSTIRIHDAISGEIVSTYKKHTDKVNTVAWSPDGRYLVSGSNDRMIFIWDTSAKGAQKNQGEVVLTYKDHTDEVNSVAWSMDGRYIVSAGSDKIVRVWNAATGLTYFANAHSLASVETVAWSHHSLKVAAASKDKKVYEWRLDSNLP